MFTHTFLYTISNKGKAIR